MWEIYEDEMHMLEEDIKMFCSTGCTFNDVGCQDNLLKCSPWTNALKRMTWISRVNGEWSWSGPAVSLTVIDGFTPGNMSGEI